MRTALSFTCFINMCAFQAGWLLLLPNVRAQSCEKESIDRQTEGDSIALRPVRVQPGCPASKSHTGASEQLSSSITQGEMRWMDRWMDDRGRCEGWNGRWFIFVSSHLFQHPSPPPWIVKEWEGGSTLPRLTSEQSTGCTLDWSVSHRAEILATRPIVNSNPSINPHFCRNIEPFCCGPEVGLLAKCMLNKMQRHQIKVSETFLQTCNETQSTLRSGA